MTNASCLQWNTPLHWAAEKARLELQRELLLRGAAVDIGNKKVHQFSLLLVMHVEVQCSLSSAVIYTLPGAGKCQRCYISSWNHLVRVHVTNSDTLLQVQISGSHSKVYPCEV